MTGDLQIIKEELFGDWGEALIETYGHEPATELNTINAAKNERFNFSEPFLWTPRTSKAYPFLSTITFFDGRIRFECKPIKDKADAPVIGEVVAVLRSQL